MPLKAAAHIEAMSAFALANFGGYERTTLAQNESAFPPSPRAIAAGQDTIARSHLYPDPDWTALREAIGRGYGVGADLILCGAGSMDLISCTIAAFAGRGDEVLGTSYAYNFAASAAARVGAAYIKAAEHDFTVSTDSILAAVTPATRIVFVCNPGNPTGTGIRNAELLRLRAALAQDVLLVIDQAYGEFDDQDPGPIFALVARGDTVVLRTLSKAYGLAGARVGWGVFPPSVAAEVRKMQNSNQVTMASLAMAVAAVEDQAYMRETVARTTQIRDRFAHDLRSAGYHVPESRTNFVLIGFSSTAAAQAAERTLRGADIIVRGLGGYGLTDCLRATVGPQEMMDRALRILIDMPSA
ncbi:MULTISPECIES: pyridoxal phosphate-dependent aminotransferase [Mesorhizobium]|uniref:Aminotransferase class I/II-fold pyridoxal phosphate-dependent enzyme n=6 Tax=Mesorhizobium TaxID=68287 RepID=A0AB38TI68_9HYPH|nr:MULTISPECIES: histidinol-phosphate transaminase [Mesorhizobium]MDF3217906.1 histidinol-phosphate transaminase [Mesorhizobium ciceri]UTU54383.1 aminotransferase class I/II-fold pyridoxal phosphate-dependent enzyme [Mesorhizobium ciceri]